MTVVCVSYILHAPVPEGFGLDYAMAVGAGMAVAAVMLGFFAMFLRSVRASGVQTPAEV